MRKNKWANRDDTTFDYRKLVCYLKFQVLIVRIILSMLSKRAIEDESANKMSASMQVLLIESVP